MRQNRNYQMLCLVCNWVGGFRFGLEIGVHNYKFSDMDWIWSLWKNFGSNPIAKFRYPYTTDPGQSTKKSRFCIQSARMCSI